MREDYGTLLERLQLRCLKHATVQSGDCTEIDRRRAKATGAYLFS